YKFPPRDTASILNLRSIGGIDLGPGASKGAFELWKTLAAEAATKPLALTLAKAWRGDRHLKTPDGEAWIIACASPTDALRLVESFWQTTDGEDHGLAVAANLDAAWRQNGQAAFAKGGRVLLLKGFNLDAGTDSPAARAAVDRYFGPPKMSVYSAVDKKTISWGDFIDRLLETDVVCVG